MFIAHRVVRLPTDTVSNISEDRLLGKVNCEPRIADNSKKGNRVRVMTFYGYIFLICSANICFKQIMLTCDKAYSL